jgi:hypothetical protein
LIDPDEWFMTALDNAPIPSKDILPPHLPESGISQSWFDKIKSTPNINVVKEGHAVSQIFGIGGFQRFDRMKICGKESPCNDVSNSDVIDYYQAGPPYIMHLEDVKKVFVKWWEFMPEAYRQLPGEISVGMLFGTMWLLPFTRNVYHL